MPRAALLSLLVASVSAQVFAADPFDPLTHPVKPTLIADTDAVVPGKPFRIGVLFRIDGHWHTYWAHPGDAGMPTRIKAEAAGVSFGEIQWPIPLLIDLGGFTSLGYEDSVLHILAARPSGDLEPGREVTIRAAVQWQVCKAEICLDGQTDLTLTLPVREQAKPANGDLFAKWQAKTPVAQDSAAARKRIASIDQPIAADGTPHSGFTVRWRGDSPPANVHWLPVATSAVAVEGIEVKHRGNVTQVRYSTEVFDAEGIADGVVRGVLVFDVGPDRRLGVTAPVRVLPAEAGQGK